MPMCPLYVVKNRALRLEPVHNHILEWGGESISIKEAGMLLPEVDIGVGKTRKDAHCVEMTSLKFSRTEYKEMILNVFQVFALPVP